MDSRKSAQLSMAVFEDMIITKNFAPHASKQHDPCTKMVKEMKDLTLKVGATTAPCDWVDLTEKLDTSQ